MSNEIRTPITEYSGWRLPGHIDDGLQREYLTTLRRAPTACSAVSRHPPRLETEAGKMPSRRSSRPWGMSRMRPASWRSRPPARLELLHRIEPGWPDCVVATPSRLVRYCEPDRQRHQVHRRREVTRSSVSRIGDTWSAHFAVPHTGVGSLRKIDACPRREADMSTTVATAAQAGLTITRHIVERRAGVSGSRDRDRAERPLHAASRSPRGRTRPWRPRRDAADVPLSGAALIVDDTTPTAACSRRCRPMGISRGGRERRRRHCSGNGVDAASPTKSCPRRQDAGHGRVAVAEAMGPNPHWRRGRHADSATQQDQNGAMPWLSAI